MIKIGILGTGTIAHAIVGGLLQENRGDLRFYLSPRNAEIVLALCRLYPKDAVAAKTNQDVVDQSDIVILSVRPQVAQDVLAPLIFRADQAIVSVIAGLTESAVRALVREAASVTLVLPLPAMAHGAAITVLTPASRDIAKLFGRAGPVLEVGSARAFASLMTATFLMATQYRLWDGATQWLVRQQIPRDQAHAYILSLASGLTRNAANDSRQDFGALEAEVSVPGSYNEGLRQHMERQGVYAALDTGMDDALARLIAFSKHLP